MGGPRSATDAWHIVAQAVEAGGEDAVTALKTLGMIDDPASRNLLRTIFNSKDGALIGDAASGLTGFQCAANLTNLEKAARDPEVQPKISILDAIARARSSEAARILSSRATFP